MKDEMKDEEKREEFLDADDLNSKFDNIKVTPRCKYFENCGGCSTQHISYDIQLSNKKNFVMSKLKKSNIMINNEIEIFHDKSYNYRNRMDPIFSPIGIGFRRKRSFHDIVFIEKCDISNDKLNILILEVNTWFNKHRDKLDVFDIKKKTGTIKYALLRAPENTDDSTISFVLNSDSSRFAELSELIIKTKEEFSSKNIIIAKVVKENDSASSQDFYVVKGSEYVKEKLLNYSYIFHSQGFFQNNTKVAEMMIRKTKDIFSKYSDIYDLSNSTLLDLYGGVGTFGIANANLFGKCLIAESFKESIECAKKNIELNNLSNTFAFCIDATYIKNSSEIFSKIDKKLRKGELFVITDPPRSGMHPKTIKFLNDISPEVIIYISCNPEQMAKELKFFKDYSVESLSLFDLFPETSHIEAIAELRKKKSEDNNSN